MVKILQEGHKTLRQTAKNIPIKDITSLKIKKIISDMKKAMYSQDDGIAIAAPQINILLRIFIVSGKIFYMETEDVEKTSKESLKKYSEKDVVFINPEIIKLSKKKISSDEGCLSIRWLYGKTKRAKQAKIKAYNEKGNVFEMGGSGILAQIFQHEVDHLNGILFIDNATHLREIEPEKTETKNDK